MPSMQAPSPSLACFTCWLISQLLPKCTRTYLQVTCTYFFAGCFLPCAPTNWMGGTNESFCSMNLSFSLIHHMIQVILSHKVLIRTFTKQCTQSLLRSLKVLIHSCKWLKDSGFLGGLWCYLNNNPWKKHCFVLTKMAVSASPISS